MYLLSSEGSNVKIVDIFNMQHLLSSVDNTHLIDKGDYLKENFAIFSTKECVTTISPVGMDICRTCFAIFSRQQYLQ